MIYELVITWFSLSNPSASRIVVGAFNKNGVRIEQDWQQAIRNAVDISRFHIQMIPFFLCEDTENHSFFNNRSFSDDARGTNMLMKYFFGNGDLQKLKDLHLMHLAAEKGKRIRMMIYFHNFFFKNEVLFNLE